MNDEIELYDSFEPIAARAIDTSVTDILLPQQSVLDEFCTLHEKALGLTWAGEALGAYLVLPTKAGEQVRLERQRVYAPVCVDEAHDLRVVVLACLRRVVERFGPGTYWTTAGRPHFVTDDGKPVVRLLRTPGKDVARYLIVRLFYFHDSGASLASRKKPVEDLNPADLQALAEAAEAEAVRAAEYANELAIAARKATP